MSPSSQQQAAVILAGGVAEFEQLLSFMTSPDTAALQHATACYEEMKKASLPGTLQRLVQTMRQSTHKEARSLSAILLRKLIVRDVIKGGTSAWADPSIDQATKEGVKRELLAVITSGEEARDVRHVVQDLVSEIFFEEMQTNNQNPWPELNPFVLQAVQSGKESVIESGLRIFSSLSSHGIGPDLETVFQMLTTFLEHTNTFIVSAAVELAASVICNAAGGKTSKDVRERLEGILGKIMQVISGALNRGDEEMACEVLELLIEVADDDPRFFRRQLASTTQAMLQIAGAAQLEASTRSLAAEFLVALCEAREKAPGMMRKVPQLIEQLFGVCMSFLLDVEEDPDWARADTEEHNSAGEGDLYEIGKEYLDRLALAVGGNLIAPIAARLLPGFITHSDWKHRQAGLLALAQTAEGCQKVLIKSASQLVDLIIRTAEDPHPRVRWSYCQTVGQLCTDLGPLLQELEHGRLMTAFLSLLADRANPRVQAHAAAALVNFSEELDNSIMAPYLERLMPIFIDLIQNGPKMVQEGGLTAMASVADAVQEHFQHYYDTVMPILSHILQNATDKEYRLLRAKALECASLIAMAVGKERFGVHAEAIMRMMKSIQESNLDADDPLLGYMQQAWTRICKCLGRDFVPYMDIVMGPLLASVQKKPNLRLLTEEDEIDPEDTDIEILPVAGARFAVSTSEIEEISTACNMVFCYVEELKDAFAPWVEVSLPQMIDRLTFVVNDDVRRSAVVAIPELLGAALIAIQQGTMPNGRDMAWLRERVVESWGAVLSAIEKELETDVRTDMLVAASDIVDAVGPASLLTLEELSQIVPLLKKVFAEAEERREQRLERTAHEDFDDDEREALEDEQELEEGALDAAQELLSSALKAFKGAALPVVEALLPAIGRLLDQGRSHEERRIAICVFDDLLEHAYEAGASRYVDTVLPILFEAAQAQQPDLRSCAIYAFGLIAERAPERSSLAAQVAQICVGMVTAADARAETNEFASDNAVSTLGKLIEHWSGSFDASAAAPAFLDYLPMKADEEEGRMAHARLIRLVMASNAALLGPGNANLPKIVRALVAIIAKGTSAAEKAVLEQMATTLQQMKAQLPADVFSHCLAALDAAQQRVLQAILEGTPLTSISA